MGDVKEIRKDTLLHKREGYVESSRRMREKTRYNQKETEAWPED